MGPGALELTRRSREQPTEQSRVYPPSIKREWRRAAATAARKLREERPRSDGGSETESCTEYACNQRHNDQRKATQTRRRPAPAIIASTGRRRPKKEGGARDRAGRRRDETAKEGVKAGVKQFCGNGSVCSPTATAVCPEMGHPPC